MNEALHLWGGTQERRARPEAAIRCMPGKARRPSAKEADDQLAATSRVSTAHPAAPAPIRLVLDDRTGPPDDGDDSDGDDDGDFVRVRDLVRVAFWHGGLGESTPPSKPPSRQARKAVHKALTNLAAKQTIRSPR